MPRHAADGAALPGAARGAHAGVGRHQQRGAAGGAAAARARRALAAPRALLRVSTPS